MRKLSLVLLAAMILAMCSVPAFAGTISLVNYILLGPSSTTAITFTGTGGGAFNVGINIPDTGLHPPTGTGFGTLASSGFYSIVSTGTTISSGAGCGTNCYLLNQTGTPLQFVYETSHGAADLLFGTLSLVDVSQSTIGGGLFNDQLVVNLTVNPSSSLASAFANGSGIVQLTLKFTTKTLLSTLLKGGALHAGVTTGVVSPVPEPGTLTLLGAGLLGFAGIWRKKKLFA